MLDVKLGLKPVVFLIPLAFSRRAFAEPLGFASRRGSASSQLGSEESGPPAEFASEFASEGRLTPVRRCALDA